VSFVPNPAFPVRSITFFVGDELCFGNERLDFVEAALARE
jgi:2-hydroxychromene-2-carboxylate isomerase